MYAKSSKLYKGDFEMNIELLVIDAQNDFCDSKGSLFVPGADADMSRLSTLIGRSGHAFRDIHATMDSHRVIDVAHPLFWKDSSGKHPSPFTLISVEDVEKGTWTTTLPGMYSRALDYAKQLAANGRYVLCIWPEHCLIGSWGQQICPVLFDALTFWERNNFGVVDYVTKGSNLYTEHYSAVQAEVPDAADASTQINTELIRTLENTDLIVIAGEASSHCVKHTVEDIANNFGDSSYVKKMVFLTDASSPVTGFEKQADDFISAMTARGMQLSTTTDFLA